MFDLSDFLIFSYRYFSGNFGALHRKQDVLLESTSESSRIAPYVHMHRKYMCLVQVDDLSLVLVNVHIKCPGIGGVSANSGNSPHAERTRLEVLQLDLLVQALDETLLKSTQPSCTHPSQPSLGSLLLGDFNLDPIHAGTRAPLFRLLE